MTLQLWAGDTSETFESLRLEDSGENEIATEQATTSYEIDTSGVDPIGVFTSAALFAAGDVGTSPEFVSMIGSDGTVIGRAALDLQKDRAYEIEREDYLGEDSDVIPPDDTGGDDSTVGGATINSTTVN